MLNNVTKKTTVNFELESPSPTKKAAVQQSKSEYQKKGATQKFSLTDFMGDGSDENYTTAEN